MVGKTNVWKVSRLPSGYQEVEYLQSSGTQYYDLGYYSDLFSYEYDLVFMNMQRGTTVAGSINTSYTPFAIGRCASNTDAITYAIGRASIFNSNSSLNNKISVVINNASNQVVENSTVLGTISNPSGGARVILFGVNSNGSARALSTCRIYSFVQKNISTGAKEIEYVPCYRTSDNVAGFYDLVSSTFVEHGGTGSFTVG